MSFFNSLIIFRNGKPDESRKYLFLTRFVFSFSRLAMFDGFFSFRPWIGRFRKSFLNLEIIEKPIGHKYIIRLKVQ